MKRNLYEPTTEQLKEILEWCGRNQLMAQEIPVSSISFWRATGTYDFLMSFRVYEKDARGQRKLRSLDFGYELSHEHTVEVTEPPAYLLSHVGVNNT